MLPSPPSTSYSRAYIHPAVSEEPGDFPLSSRSNFDDELSQPTSHISNLFLLFPITCYFFVQVTFTLIFFLD
ncbi:hypothetical protein HDV63DRAFT_109518 [Trichoderma sp. SZMC 28014]